MCATVSLYAGQCQARERSMIAMNPDVSSVTHKLNMKRNSFSPWDNFFKNIWKFECVLQSDGSIHWYKRVASLVMKNIDNVINHAIKNIFIGFFSSGFPNHHQQLSFSITLGYTRIVCVNINFLCNLLPISSKTYDRYIVVYLQITLYFSLLEKST